MNTINERIRELRKALGLSGEKFGESLGITRGTISRIENGTISVTEANIKMLITLYGINEQWLREGVGEMFAPKDEAERIIERLGTDDPFIKDMVRLVLQMSDEYALRILDEVKVLAEKYKKNP